MFLLKKKPIVLDLFTDHAGVFERSRPSRSVDFIPEWWKNLDRTYNKAGTPPHPGATMRSCMGFIELYKHGFIVPMWCDMVVDIDGNKGYGWKFSDDSFQAVVHDTEQAGKFFIDNKVRNLKLICPWLAMSKEDVVWHCSHPIWNQNFQYDWVAPSAAVNFKYQFELNINLMLLRITRTRSFIIPFTLPMIHYFPMSERPVKLVYHQISEKERNNILQRNTRVSFVNSYTKKLKAIGEKIGYSS